MPIVRSRSPKHSRDRLSRALEAFGDVKARHRHWMKSSASPTDGKAALHQHPVYTVRLRAFLEGKPLSATLKKAAWMYFLRDRAKRLACAEVSIVSGKHKHVRLSEGPFVKNLFQVIEKLNADKRVVRSRYELRAIRLESLHSFCIWLKLNRQNEYFIPVSSGGPTLKKGDWLSRKEFAEGLWSEAQRVRAARARMSKLLETHQGSA
jgi:hypothetical protein